MTCATRAQFSGSVSRTQSSFVKVKLVSGGLQVSLDQGFEVEQQHGPVNLSQKAKRT